MKLRFLASLSVLLAVGCSQTPTSSPVSDASPDVKVSIPDVPSESTANTEAAANETLVSFNVPDMH
ncbi:MAG: hypothetical protein ABI614_26160 [Planctomycetota bacterium]